MILELKNNRVWFFTLCSCMVLHAALVLTCFPPSSAVNGNPLISGDLGWHLTDAAEGQSFLKEQGHLWGYSPSLMAGYPWGIWSSVSKRGYEFAPALFPFASVEMAFYIWLVLTAFLTPLLLPLACLLFGFDRKTVRVCFGLSIAVYQAGSLILGFWTYGMVAFTFTSALVILYLAALFRLLSMPILSLTGGKRSFLIRGLWSVFSGILLGLIFWLHPLCMLTVGIGTLAIFWEKRSELFRIDQALGLAMVALVALVVVLPWLIPLIRFMDTRSMGPEALPSGIPFFIMDFLSDRAYRHHFDRRILFHTIIMLSGLGAWLTHPGRCHASKTSDAERKAINIMIALSIGLLLCAYLFPYSEVLKQFQPYRFVMAAKLCLIIPATVGLIHMTRLWKDANSPGRILAGMFFIVTIPALTGYAVDWKYRKSAHGLSADQQKVVNWCKSIHNGRILCEDEILGGLIPHFTGHETIGGCVSTLASLPHNWASVSPNKVFGLPRSIRTRSSAELVQYLDLYNIEKAIVVSDEFAQELSELGSIFREDRRVGSYKLFVRSDGRNSFVQNATSNSPSTRIEAGPNMIRIICAPTGRFVIKYHYLKTLAPLEESVTIKPLKLLDDPVPFIEVENPKGLKDIVIHNVY